MSAIGKAFEAIGHGIEKAFSGIGHLAKGVLTLNPKELAKGTCDIASGGMDFVRGEINMLPACRAANILMDGALDKILRNVQGRVEQGMSNTFSSR